MTTKVPGLSHDYGCGELTDQLLLLSVLNCRQACIAQYKKMRRKNPTLIHIQILIGSWVLIIMRIRYVKYCYYGSQITKIYDVRYRKCVCHQVIFIEYDYYGVSTHSVLAPVNVRIHSENF